MLKNLKHNNKCNNKIKMCFLTKFHLAQNLTIHKNLIIARLLIKLHNSINQIKDNSAINWIVLN